MILYHGTNVSFREIDLSKGKVAKDFGVGFYLTDDQNVARRQAERKYAQFGEGEICVQSYSFELNQELKVLQFEGYTLEWAQFILANRKNRTRVQLHDYDIVIGPIADDTVGYQIRRLEDGIINMEQFLEEIKFHHITKQYFFATPKAIKILIQQ